MAFFETITKNLARVFTWPNRYRTELPLFAPTTAGELVTPERALSVSAVAACVRLLSETTAALPLHVYRDLGNSRLIEGGHPLYNLIHSQPNEFMSSFTFFQTAIMHILLHGNHYSVIERDGAGNPVNLWPLRPEGVTVEVRDGNVEYRYYFGGQRSTYDFRDILHFKGPSLDGIVGMSIVGMARQGIGLALAQDAHAGSLMRNNARLGTVITVPGSLRSDQLSDMREDFAKKFAGAMNAGKAVVMYDGMTIQTVGMSSQDAQFIESRQFSVVEIARWFRVPPTLIGDMTRVSYSSSESEMQLFCTQSIAPLCASIEAELNFKLLPSRTQFLARFDINKLVRGDQQSRYTAYSQGLNAGFLTVADVRLAEDLPFIEGTDKLNRPANLVPHEGGSNGNPQPIANDKVAE